MSLLRMLLAAACVVVISGSANADSQAVRNGTDTFVAGGAVTQMLHAPGDAFVAGRSAVARGAAEGDLHVSGFDVSVSANTDKDLYAVGATVVVRGTVAEDLTAAGFTIRTEPEAKIGGNARLFGNSVAIEGPIEGSLTTTAREVVLNAAVTGDVRILAKRITFGPKAVVSGTLTYSREVEMEVPARVAPADRVAFEKYTASGLWKDVSGMGKDQKIQMFPTAASLFFGFIVSLLFFVVLGALALGFFPVRVEALRRAVTQEAGYSLIFGVLGLSVLFGMVPITGLTVVGLPFVPIVILGIVLAWTLGYALGAYAFGMRLFSGLGGDEPASMFNQLLVLAGSLVVIALLNFIPFVGWVANYTLVLLGIGAMTRALVLSLTDAQAVS